MSYQDGRRVEALEAAVRELRERVERLEALLQPSNALDRPGGLGRPTSIDVRLGAVERTVEALQTKLTERPALARRRA